MLTKTAIMVLGVIAGEPINPYAIGKLINYRRENINKLFLTPPSTVYGIINKFEKKGFIIGKRTRNGNMPDRTVYSITANGEKVLKKSLYSYLSTPEHTLSELSLSILLLDLLDTEKVLESLKKYRKIIEGEITIRKKLYKVEEEEHGANCIGLIALEHVLNGLALKLRTVKKLIGRIEQGTQLDREHVPFWRNDALQKRKSRRTTQPPIMMEPAKGEPSTKT